MAICPATAPAPLRCPTLIESILATLTLLPRGRVWPANDGGAILSRFMTWLDGLAGAVPVSWPAGFVQVGFFAAIGAVRNYLEARLCDLRLEFWCATMSETRDQWLLEYGLPDSCDPFPDLCTKVAAIGGARCDYFNAIVSRAGWSVECDDFSVACGSPMGGAQQMGCSQMGASRANILRLIVHTGESPAFVGRMQTPPLMGMLLMGKPIACAPDIEPLRCLMDRIAPAHVDIDYITVM